MRTFKNLMLFVAVFLQSSCFEGPGFFQKDGGTISKYSVVSKADGGVTEGEFSASNTATQVLGVKDGSQISGASLSIQPGALAVDTRISLQEGASIASSGLASEIGISGAVSPAGPAVVLSSSIAIDASQPMKVKLPKKSSSLNLAENENVIVVYRAFQAALDRTVVGVIPTSELKITDDTVEASTRFFGSYQVAIAEVAVKKAIVKESATPILTKNEEKKLPRITLDIVAQPFLKEGREAEVGIKLSSATQLIRCSAFVFENSDSVWIFSDSANNKDELAVISSGQVDTYTYSPESEAAQTVYFRFACVDDNGRDIVSKSTAKISIPAKSNGGGGTTAFAIVGWAAYENSPALRVMGTTVQKVLQGSCESGTDVKIYVDSGANPANHSVSCTSDQFALTIDPVEGCSPVNGVACVGTAIRGYRIWAMQDYDSLDETYVYVSNVAPMLLTNANFYTQLNAAVASTLYIVAEPIVLGSAWTPITSLNATVEGEGHAISGFSVTDGSMFTNISATGRIAHIVFENPILRTTNRPSITQLGIVAGAITSSVIDDVTINRPDLLTSATSVTSIGAFAGRVLSNAKIRSIAVRGDSLNRSTYGVFSDTGMYVGGVIGSVDDSNLEDILVDSIKVRGLLKIGGIMGGNLHIPRTPPDLVLKGARVDVVLESTQSSGSPAYVGGIVGFDDMDTDLDSIQVKVEFKASYESKYYGGVVGAFHGKVRNADVTAIAVGNNTDFPANYIGGVGGYHSGGSVYTSILRPQFNTDKFNMGVLSGGEITNLSAIFSDVVLASDSDITRTNGSTSTPAMKLHSGATPPTLTSSENRIAYPSTMTGPTALDCNVSQTTFGAICHAPSYNNTSFGSVFSGFDFITAPKWFTDSTRFEPYVKDIPNLNDHKNQTQKNLADRLQ